MTLRSKPYCGHRLREAKMSQPRVPATPSTACCRVNGSRAGKIGRSGRRRLVKIGDQQHARGIAEIMGALKRPCTDKRNRPCRGSLAAQRGVKRHLQDLRTGIALGEPAVGNMEISDPETVRAEETIAEFEPGAEFDFGAELNLLAIVE